MKGCACAPPVDGPRAAPWLVAACWVVPGPFAAPGLTGAGEPPVVNWTAVYPPAATTQAAAAAANARAATGLVRTRRRPLAARENSTTVLAVSWSLDRAGAVAGPAPCAPF